MTMIMGEHAATAQPRDSSPPAAMRCHRFCHSPWSFICPVDARASGSIRLVTGVRLPRWSAFLQKSPGLWSGGGLHPPPGSSFQRILPLSITGHGTAFPTNDEHAVKILDPRHPKEHLGCLWTICSRAICVSTYQLPCLSIPDLPSKQTLTSGVDASLGFEQALTLGRKAAAQVQAPPMPQPPASQAGTRVDLAVLGLLAHRPPALHKEHNYGVLLSLPVRASRAISMSLPSSRRYASVAEPGCWLLPCCVT